MCHTNRSSIEDFPNPTDLFSVATDLSVGKRRQITTRAGWWLRDECLNMHQLASLAEAQTIIDSWWIDHNHHRPHSSLGHLRPTEFVTQRQEERAVEEVVCSGEELPRNGATSQTTTDHTVRIS